jgi:hypothetical protein
MIAAAHRQRASQLAVSQARERDVRFDERQRRDLRP